MDLSTLQREQLEWVKKNFPSTYKDPSVAFRGIVEELGEMSHATLKMDQNIRGGVSDHYMELRDSVGDLVIYLVQFCTIHGINCGNAVWETWQKVKERDWIKFPFNGVDK